MFGENIGAARRAYRTFVKNGIARGRRVDLTGGGLLRSAGGWEGVKLLREEKVYQKNDERILGGEGTGHTDVFPGTKAGNIDSVCQ